MNMLLKLARIGLTISFVFVSTFIPLKAYSEAPPAQPVSTDQTGQQVPVKQVAPEGPQDQPASGEEKGQESDKGASPADTTRFFLEGDTVVSSDQEGDRSDLEDNRAKFDSRKIISKELQTRTSYDAFTGITTKVARNVDGSRTISQVDEYGQVLESETISKGGKELISGFEFDPDTGITLSVIRNRDGSHTVTQTDDSGEILAQETIGRKTLIKSLDQIEPVKIIAPVALPTALSTPIKLADDAFVNRNPIQLMQQKLTAMSPDQGKVLVTSQSPTNQVDFKLPNVNRGSDVQQSLRNFYGGIYEIPALVDAEETKKDEWRVKFVRSKLRSKNLQDLPADLVTLKLINGKMLVTQVMNTDALGNVINVTDLTYNELGQLIEKRMEQLNKKGEKQQQGEIFYEQGQEALSVLKFFVDGVLDRQSYLAREFDKAGNLISEIIWTLDRDNNMMGTQVNRYVLDAQGKAAYRYQMEYSANGDLMQFYFTTGIYPDQKTLEVKMLADGAQAQVKMTTPSRQPGKKEESEKTVASEELQKLVDDFFKKTGKSISPIDLSAKAPEFPLKLRSKK